MIRLLAAFACLLTLHAGAALALDPAKTGVLLLHGKWGQPANNDMLADTLQDAGFLTDAPELAWSGRRMFDQSFTNALADIDAAVARLKARGASRIVLAGHSLGGDAALRYAMPAHHTAESGLAALVLMAPAHFPEGKYFSERTVDMVAEARARVAAGRGGEKGNYVSLNSGNRSRPITASAEIFLSYYDPEGPAAMSRFAPAVKPLPTLWIAPKQDPTTAVFAKLVQPNLPAGLDLTRADVPGDHLDAPSNGRSKAVDWLKALPE